MRKLVLISAFVLASASAQAGDIGSLIPAANDTPAATSTATPAEATPAARRDIDEQKARQIAAQYGISW
jgi:hypothetical protein